MPGFKLKVQSLKLKVLLLFTFSFLLILLTPNFQTATIYAACTTTATNSRFDWLLTSGGGASTQFKANSTTNPSGTCITSNPAAQFGSGFIDTYSALKTKYFTNPGGTTGFTGAITNDTRYNVTGNLSLSSLSGSGAGLFFVDGDLTITGNLNYSGNTNGAVFVMSGNVLIDPAVTNIDAFIIAAGTSSIVCTGSTTTPCATNSVSTANRLTVNGSIISLSTQNPSIFFNRTWTDNTLSREVFNFQPKYYVLFKDLFSDSRQTWKEVAGLASNFTP